MTDAALIDQLGIPHRATAAYRMLFAMGFAALPLARQGLRHTNATVRYRCCKFLDHYLVPDVLPDLVALLDDPHPRVRVATLHALACDRCKEGACRPEEGNLLPKALRILKEDRAPHVRAMAIEVVGQYAHTNLVAEAALVESRSHDPSPMVRKKAGWYAPGGTIHRRTAPRPARVKRS
jgi:HEAT repeat protein